MAQAEPGARQPLPDWYQQNDMSVVFDRIIAGEFCEVLGVGSAGKSNFIRHLTRPDVKRRYLQQMEPYFITVLLNPHLMIDMHAAASAQVGGAWMGYEMMLSRLRRELIDLERRRLLPKQPEDGDVISQVEKRYANLFSTHALISQSGIRHLEDAVYEVLALGPQWTLVFLFDEMEEFMRLLPAEFFQSLRGVRDEFKGRVVYVTTSRVPLAEIAAPKTSETDAMVMQGFLELFHGFTYHMQRLDEQSAYEIVRRLEQRNRTSLPIEHQKRLLQASGHHAGLIRRGFVPTVNFALTRQPEKDYFPMMLSDRGIRQECAMIYDSLLPDERATLLEITADRSPRSMTTALQGLMDKHLVIQHDRGYFHAIPLLGGYLREFV